MSRIDDLIRELCPDGVEFKPLREIGGWQGGGTPSKQNPDYWRGGTVPWVTSKDMGGLELAGTEDCITEAAVGASAAKIIPSNSVAIVMRSGILKHTLPVSYVPFRATVNQDLRAVSCHDDVMPRYVLHVLRAHAEQILITCRKVGGTVESIDASRLMAFRIPVPPLEVQREIVRILDLFTTLEAELEAELEARRRQYAHYRDSLLTFPEGGVRWATLGEICVSVASGGTPLSTRSDYYGGDIPWLRTQEVHYSDIYSTEATITQAGLGNSSARWVPADSVIIAISGAGVTRGRVAVNRIPLTTNQHCCSLAIDPAKADFRFVYYWLVDRYEDIRARGQGNRSDLNVGIIRAFPIPVPPLEEQARIVAILDKFDALVNDLNIGLPAELAARRKQYEYYRDRLLTFKEAAA